MAKKFSISLDICVSNFESADEARAYVRSHGVFALDPLKRLSPSVGNLLGFEVIEIFKVGEASEVEAEADDPAQNNEYNDD